MFNSITPQTHARLGTKAASKTAARPAAKAAAKPLLCALLTLAVAAGVLLAVALPEPTPAAAQQHNIDLLDASDTGADDTGNADSTAGPIDPSRLNADNRDNITSDNTPSFRIATRLPSMAMLTIKARNEATGNTVSRTVMNTTTVEFDGDVCDTVDGSDSLRNQSCTLDDGRWDISGNISAGGHDTGLTGPRIRIDTVAPTVEVSVDKPSIEINEVATVTFDFSELIVRDTFTVADDLGAFTGFTVGALDKVGKNERLLKLEVTGTIVGGHKSFGLNIGTFADLAGNFNTAASAPSPAPAVTVFAEHLAAPMAPDLATESDSGPDDTGSVGSPTDPTDPPDSSRLTADNMDNLTNEDKPKFAVTLPIVVANGLVTVTATQGTGASQITVSRTITGVAGSSAVVDFGDGDNCDASAIRGTPGSESCTLVDGTWEVTATYTINDQTSGRSQTSERSAVLGASTTPAQRKLLVIDTVKPSVAVTVAEPNLGLASPQK